MFRNVASSLLLILGLSACTSPSHETESGLVSWIEQHSKLSQSAVPEIAIAATLAGSASDPTLRFRIVNISSAEVVLPSSSLPWGNAESLRVLALSPTGESLERVYLLDGQLFPEPVTIPPGASLEGSAPISNFFVEEWPRPHHTLVLWSYSLPSNPAGARAVATGHIVIPARGGAGG
jgi:hypothetical protein